MTKLFFLFLFLSGCNQQFSFYPHEQIIQSDNAVAVDSFIQNESIDKLDIMTIIDTSCSMQDGDLDRVIDGMSTLRSDISTLSDNYQFGFLNTNLLAYTFLGPLDKTSSDLDFKMSIESLGETYAETAFSPMYRYSTYDQTFYRDNADLLVFIFSDENDQSNISAQEFYEWITTKWPTKIVDVVSVVPGEETCGNIPQKYVELENLFGKQPIDLCNSNWENWLSTSSFLTTYKDSITLTNIPIEDSIIVYIDHVAIEEWTYDKSVNTVYFDDIPSPGSLVEVGYNIQ